MCGQALVLEDVEAVLLSAAPCVHLLHCARVTRAMQQRQVVLQGVAQVIAVAGGGGSKFIGEKVNEEEEQHFDNQKSMRWMNGVMRKKNNDRGMTGKKSFCFTPDSTSIFLNIFFLDDIQCFFP